MTPEKMLEEIETLANLVNEAAADYWGGCADAESLLMFTEDHAERIKLRTRAGLMRDKAVRFQEALVKYDRHVVGAVVRDGKLYHPISRPA